MDNHQILTEEEHMETSLIHKKGHWTQPPPSSTDSEAGTQEFSVRWLFLY